MHLKHVQHGPDFRYNAREQKYILFGKTCSDILLTLVVSALRLTVNPILCHANFIVLTLAKAKHYLVMRPWKLYAWIRLNIFPSLIIMEMAHFFLNTDTFIQSVWFSAINNLYLLHCSEKLVALPMHTVIKDPWIHMGSGLRQQAE